MGRDFFYPVQATHTSFPYTQQPIHVLDGFHHSGIILVEVKTEERNMNNSSERLTNLVAELDDPVMGAFLVKSIGHSETLIRKAARARRRTYSSCTSAARNGLAKSAILQALNSSVKEGKYAAAAVNITDSADRLAHEATQQQIRSSLAMAA